MSGKRLERSQLSINTVIRGGRAQRELDLIVDSRDSILTLSEDAQLEIQNTAAGRANDLEGPRKSRTGRQTWAVRKEPRGWMMGLSHATFPSLENSCIGLRSMGQLEVSHPLQLTKPT